MSTVLSILCTLPLLSGSGEPSPPAVRLVDLTGDGLADVLHLNARGIAVSVNCGGGIFDAVPQELPAVTVTDALASDLDGDGLVDLYLVSPTDNVALRGDGAGRFREATEAFGLADAGRGVSAERVDLDGSGADDLLLHNAGGDVVFWATGAGFRRDAMTPQARATDPPDPLAVEQLVVTAGELLDLAPDGQIVIERGPAGDARVALHPAGGDRPRDAGSGAPSTAPNPGVGAGPTPGADMGAGGATSTAGLANTASAACALSIKDQATGGCLQATSVPTPGMLFPPPHTGGTGNSSIGSDAFVGGGANNSVNGVNSSIVGGNGNSVNANSSFIGGGVVNIIVGTESTIGGGVFNGITGDEATIGGGSFNDASGDESTVGGGAFNNASGNESTIAGGDSNTASATRATVGGGSSNTASGENAVVAGGRSNDATGLRSAIPGGYLNVAAGETSFAAGFRARANHDGAFVWADSEVAFFDSTADDQFLIRAAGGVGIGTETPISPLEVAGRIRSSGPDGGAFTANNPNNYDAAVGLSWLNDVPRIRIGGSGAGSANGFDIQTIDDVSLLRITDAGEVGIGTTSPDADLHIDTQSDVTPTGGGIVQLGLSSALNMGLDANEIMVRNNGVVSSLNLNREGGDVLISGVSSSGDVGIGTLSPSERLDVVGNIECVALIQTSDARYKRDVEDMVDALDTVKRLRGVTYVWDREKLPAADEGRTLGFLAQEVREVLPEAVKEADDGMLAVSYTAIVPVLAEAIDELAADRDELGVELDALRRANAALAARLARLEASSRSTP